MSMLKPFLCVGPCRACVQVSRPPEMISLAMKALKRCLTLSFSSRCRFEACTTWPIQFTCLQKLGESCRTVMLLFREGFHVARAIKADCSKHWQRIGRYTYWVMIHTHEYTVPIFIYIAWYITGISINWTNWNGDHPSQLFVSVVSVVQSTTL